MQSQEAGQGLKTMAKTQITLDLEKALKIQTANIFGCSEVTIGWWQIVQQLEHLNLPCERVDYLTLDFKGEWRCYEVKSCMADFNSKAKKTFLGHYNYYVVPPDLVEKIKSLVPKHIGIKTLDERGYIKCVKNAKKQEVSDLIYKILSCSMIRSLSYRQP